MMLLLVRSRPPRRSVRTTVREKFVETRRDPVPPHVGLGSDSDAHPSRKRIHAEDFSGFHAKEATPAKGGSHLIGDCLLPHPPGDCSRSVPVQSAYPIHTRPRPNRAWPTMSTAGTPIGGARKRRSNRQRRAEYRRRAAIHRPGR